MADNAANRQGGNAANGKAAKQQSSKRQGNNAANRQDSKAQCSKVTLRLSEMTAKRLAVYAAMSGEGQSDIAERVLSAHLARFRIQTNVWEGPAVSTDGADGAESAA